MSDDPANALHRLCHQSQLSELLQAQAQAQAQGSATVDELNLWIAVNLGRSNLTLELLADRRA